MFILYQKLDVFFNSNPLKKLLMKFVQQQRALEYFRALCFEEEKNS